MSVSKWIKLTHQQEKDLYDYCNIFFDQGYGFHVIAKLNDWNTERLRKIYFQICKKYKWVNYYPVKVIEITPIKPSIEIIKPKSINDKKFLKKNK